MIEIPSYLLKLRYGAVAQRTLQQIRSSEQPKSKDDVRNAMVSHLSTIGIIGSNPVMFSKNEDYIDKLVEIFKNKGPARASAMVSDEFVNDETETDELVTEVDDSSVGKSPSAALKAEPLDSAATSIDCQSLPSRWITPKECQFELSLDGLEISTKNPTKSVSSTSSITVNLPHHGRSSIFSTKANFSVHETIGIYYYEVEVLFGLNSGSEITIGYMDGDQPEEIISSLRGHDENAWGYKGKDGKLVSFEECRSSVRTSCKFGNKDVVGCGVNFVNRSIFITKNGVFLGEAFSLPSNMKRVVPVVSLGSWNSISTNFGHTKSFRFNIDNYVDSFKLRFLKTINNHQVPSVTLDNGTEIKDSNDMKNSLNQMIKKYFEHRGYANALKSFEKDLSLEGRTEPPFPIRRESYIKKQLKDLISSNEIGLATDLISSNFPGLLEDNTDIQFKLDCLKLVNMVGNDSEGQFIKLAKQMKSTYTSEQYQKTLNDLLGLLAYDDPTATVLYKSFVNFERARLVHKLCMLINMKSGIPALSNFEQLIQAADSMVAASNDLNTALIDIVNDFVQI
ncbi:hypothetical protein KL936_002931 [Ogataea polymorpha]|nr:hypothetical protein KL936_002931 [Ogataea polymorpha]